MSKQANAEAVTGERPEGTLFQPEFNRAVRVEAAQSAVTDDAGALLLREVADQLGYRELAASLLDHRARHLVTHPLTELVLTRVLLLAQGWRDQDYADVLRDPAYPVFFYTVVPATVSGTRAGRDGGVAHAHAS